MRYDVITQHCECSSTVYSEPLRLLPQHTWQSAVFNEVSLISRVVIIMYTNRVLKLGQSYVDDDDDSVHTAHVHVYMYQCAYYTY